LNNYELDLKFWIFFWYSNRDVWRIPT